ncbi:MAG TPA: endolytic transglycosylase MltG [Gemmatimonadaceae bacterium]|nr:endolytic transglycosylase MltG [Gemmatimonadaceae bacterium]
MRSASRSRQQRRHWRRAALAALLWATTACGPSDAAPVRVVVPAGASFGQAADSLERAGIIGSARLFRLYASLRNRDRALKAGTYELRPGESWNALLSALTEGRGLVATVTIPEGFDLGAIVPLVAQRLEVPADSVRAAVRDTSLRRRLGVPTETLEGYLFPETYSFALGTSAREAVGTMVQEFEKRWRPAWTARLDTLGMTRHEVVTLASIVEKEARVPEERPLIAAVYCNRLREGMLLQADPTVQYALGRHVDRVLYAHLQTDSPYNTYRHAGLPPGPIASPGAASLEAALYPADVPYLYFVARPDGRHEFRTTFAEHTRAREEVRRIAERLARERARRAGMPAGAGVPAAGPSAGGQDSARRGVGKTGGAAAGASAAPRGTPSPGDSAAASTGRDSASVRLRCR